MYFEKAELNKDSLGGFFQANLANKSSIIVVLQLFHFQISVNI